MGLTKKECFPWTEAVMRQVEKMWAEGLTIRQIGEAIGASRNSVIGRVHRMGLPSRPSPIGGRGPKREAQERKPVVRKTVAPKTAKAAVPVSVKLIANRKVRVISNAADFIKENWNKRDVPMQKLVRNTGLGVEQLNRMASSLGLGDRPKQKGQRSLGTVANVHPDRLSYAMNEALPPFCQITARLIALPSEMSA